MDPTPDSPVLFVIWKKYKIPLIFGAASLFFIILSLVLIVKSIQTVEPITFNSRSEVLGENASKVASLSANIKAIYVDIEGAVVSPGLIGVAIGSRVEDVIVAAGGLHRDADEEYVARKINRAMKVTDGMKLYIPKKNETSHNTNAVILDPKDVAQYNNVKQSDISSGQDSQVSINMASPDELDSLPGIGPVTVQKIIDNRPYYTLDELISKKVVGSSVFEKISSLIVL